MAFDKDTIIAKVKAGKQLTREEELFYMTEVVGYSKDHAERILAINDQTTENRIID
jgi:hypothetical protein